MRSLLHIAPDELWMLRYKLMSPRILTYRVVYLWEVIIR